MVKNEILTDGRTLKRLATRQRISDVATGLFMERGFDAVTVDQIAEAAQVSRMTVFNHFARKEDMLFDLDEMGRQDVLAALENKAADVSPVEALRRFAHQVVAERRPYVLFSHTGGDRFVATVKASEALLARARAIRDELTDLLAGGLATCAGRADVDAHATLAATLIVSTWTVSFLEGRRVFNESRDEAKAYAAFLALIDQGSEGVTVAVRGTPYA